MAGSTDSESTGRQRYIGSLMGPAPAWGAPRPAYAAAIGSRLGQLALALAAAALLASGCGDEEDAPPVSSTEATESQTVPASGGSEEEFNAALAGTCTDFYEQVAPLQGELQGLAISEESPQPDKEQAIEIVEEIQGLSSGFLEDLRALPEPAAAAARDDYAALVKSTEEFLGIQAGYFDTLREGVLSEEGSVDPAELTRVQGELGDELKLQQALIDRLGVPECLPQ